MNRSLVLRFVSFAFAAMSLFACGDPDDEYWADPRAHTLHVGESITLGTYTYSGRDVVATPSTWVVEPGAELVTVERPSDAAYLTLTALAPGDVTVTATSVLRHGSPVTVVIQILEGDGGTPNDSAIDAGVDASNDAGVDAANDAAIDAAIDATVYGPAQAVSLAWNDAATLLATDTAGVRLAGHWNTALGATASEGDRGTKSNLVDTTGAATGVRVTWSGADIGDTM